MDRKATTHGDTGSAYLLWILFGGSAKLLGSVELGNVDADGRAERLGLGRRAAVVLDLLEQGLKT